VRLQTRDRPTHLHAGRGQARADGLEVRVLAKIIARAAHKQQGLTQLDKRHVPQALLRAAHALDPLGHCTCVCLRVCVANQGTFSAWTVLAGRAEAALSEGLRPVRARAPPRDNPGPGTRKHSPPAVLIHRAQRQPIHVLIRLHLLARGVQRVAEKDARQHIRVARRDLARHATSLHAWSSALAERYAGRLQDRPARRPVILSNRNCPPSFVLTCHQPAPWSDPPVSSAGISARGRAPGAPGRPPRACPGTSASGSARS